MDYGKLKKSFEDHRFLTSYFETKEEAMRREYAIKRLPRRKKLELLGGR